LETALLVDAWQNKISVLVLHSQLIASLVGRQVEWNSSEGRTQSLGGGQCTPWLRAGGRFMLILFSSWIVSVKSVKSIDLFTMIM